MDTNVRVYVGCALAYGPKKYVAEITAFKRELRKIPWITVLEFCAPPPGAKQSDLSPGEIYKNDIIDCVGSADVVIGEFSYPSTGLGGEFMAGMQNGVRVMMFAKEGKRVSKLWLGAPEHHSNATFAWYSGSLRTLLPDIIGELEQIHIELNE